MVRYAEACILQLSLLVQVADGPYVFGIMGPCGNALRKGFERYRVTTFEVLWQLAGAQGLTCDEVFDEVIILEELKGSAWIHDTRTLAEHAERRMIQETSVSGSLTALPSVTPSSVQSGGKSFLHTLSERFQQTYEPYTIPGAGENLETSTQQHEPSLTAECQSKSFDSRDSASCQSKRRRRRWNSEQAKSPAPLREDVRGCMPMKIKGMQGQMCIVQIHDKWGATDPKGIVKDLSLLLSLIKGWEPFQRHDWAGQPSSSVLKRRRALWYDRVALTIWAAAALVDAEYKEVAAEVSLLKDKAETSLGLRLSDSDLRTLANSSAEIQLVDQSSVLYSSVGLSLLEVGKSLQEHKLKWAKERRKTRDAERKAMQDSSQSTHDTSLLKSSSNGESRRSRPRPV